MDFHQKTAEIYIPDGSPMEKAISRTTHLCIAAHQDDIEMMSIAPILACYKQTDQWFTGVVATDGRGAPRAGIYANYTDDEIRSIRAEEQKKAALVGEYAAQILLDYPSKMIKDSSKSEPLDDFKTLLKATVPRFVYTHNLADKHDTHVGVALRVIQAIRELPKAKRPEKLYGCELWSGLDWMMDSEKVTFDTSAHKNLQTALVEVFESQIAGGKRYDLAALGRRRANATFFQSHEVDSSEGMSYAMDLTPLIVDDDLDPLEFTQGFIHRFADDVANRMRRMG
jgi:LmbE family N-acetylglucosaminyl deacetylase